MADILKITTPLISKNTNLAIKHSTDPTVPFNIQDLAKVDRPNAQSELSQQNNSMLQQDEPLVNLMNLLKDPAVTVGFLKNIYLLQEVINLLSINSHPFTEEIKQLFEALIIGPEEIIPELNRQAETTTYFHGEFYEALRSITNNTTNLEVSNAVADILKALNSHYTKTDIMNSISNNFSFLANAFKTSPNLSAKLTNLAEQFRQKENIEIFNILKDQSIQLLNTLEDSILYSPKIAKNISILLYNLSRFNDNQEFLDESITRLSHLLEKHNLQDAFLSKFNNAFNNYLNENRQKNANSQVMDTLAALINKEKSEDNLSFLNADKIEKIIQSLLSSPCNYTPLMHFVLPVKFEYLNAFAEIWIDQNDSNDLEIESQSAENIHLLIIFDIEQIGLFETEISVRQGVINLQLLCPLEYVEDFSNIGKNLRKTCKDCSYIFDKISVAKLVKLRSLLEVFPSLPKRRSGIDVKA